MCPTVGNYCVWISQTVCKPDSTI